MMQHLRRRLRPAIGRSWLLSRLWYRLHGLRIEGRLGDEVWYFASGANMHDSAFRGRRGMCPLEWRAGRIRGYRLRFKLEGRPIGKAAPASICLDPEAEVWGVLYRITRAGLVQLDSTEGVPGPRYRHFWLDAEDIEGRPLKAVTYIAHRCATSRCCVRVSARTACLSIGYRSSTASGTPSELVGAPFGFG